MAESQEARMRKRSRTIQSSRQPSSTSPPPPPYRLLRRRGVDGGGGGGGSDDGSVEKHVRDDNDVSFFLLCFIVYG